ncbi:short-chain fatty acid transporter [Halomonas cupida]|uniref:short-chain fatty acid transporter n=1 Tax=Halomonas TaxID=2745 RepID=UPI001A903CB1|nr:TIGR00366 family protein [Halomonas litopenaei]MBN8412574.1 short-chain fatty acid transporter [Halomonas litopenaei]
MSTPQRSVAKPSGSGRSFSSFMQRLGDGAASFGIRWIPDPFALAVILTLMVFGAALAFTPHGPVELIDQWYGGFWRLLTFAMQMVLIVVTGFGLATAPSMQRALRWVASLPRSRTGAIVVTALAGSILSFLHWGVGLIVSAFLAREVARYARDNGLAVHFPLLAAAAYGGGVISQTGLTSSGALLVNTPGHFLESSIGLIPLSETIFQPYNLIFVLLTVVVTPLLLALLHPSPTTTVVYAGQDDEDSMEEPLSDEERRLPANRVNRSRILCWAIALGGLFFVVRYIVAEGLLGLDLNVLNFGFLMLGLLMHGSLGNYSRAIMRASSAAGGIILQFPFYAGILGLMAGSGLFSMIADWFVSISTPDTFPLYSMISAALVNFAVPSGGGQWAVQGPIATAAALQLGLPAHLAVMSVMMGDQLTNLAQPFWLLPILGVTGLKAGQVMGYTILLMFVVFIINAACLLWLV